MCHMPQSCELILTDDLVEECSNHHTDTYKNDVNRDVMFELVCLSFNWSSENQVQLILRWSLFYTHDKGKWSSSVSVSDD